MIPYAHGFINEETTRRITYSGYYGVIMKSHYKSVALMHAAVHLIE